ncbi:MAG: hypothetical protein V3U90_02390 [Dehalococcoidia bacterium]
MSLKIGATQQFLAQAFDRYDNEITGLAVQWTSTDEGTISETGSFQASTKAGVFEEGVTAAASFKGVIRTGRATVTVNPDPLDHIELTPLVLILDIEEQQQLAVGAFDKYNNVTEEVAVSWAVLTGGGAIDTESRFIAGSEPGTFNDAVQVTVTQDQITERATATVLVKPEPLPPYSATAKLARIDLETAPLARPRSISISAEVPSEVTTAPESVEGKIFFGRLTFGESTVIPVAIDAISDQEARVFLDVNQNGDLTDDATFLWCYGSECPTLTTRVAIQVAYSTGSKLYRFGFCVASRDPPWVFPLGWGGLDGNHRPQRQAENHACGREFKRPIR